MDLRLCVPREVEGKICLPASKSISNRMLLLRVLAGNSIALHNVSDCDDTRAMEHGLKCAGGMSPVTIDVGAAGTAMRFLTAYFASTPCEVVMTGSERMLHRPIGVLVDALRSLGADIGYEGEEGFPPLRIRGRQLEGGSVRMKGSVSSQYVSALLMVAPTMRCGLTLTLEGNIISRPYIGITTSLMRRFGVTVEEPDDRTFCVEPGKYTGGEYTIENDWSAASYWYELLALADDGEIALEGLFEDSLQGDSCVRRLFEPLGITTVFDESGAVLRKIEKLKNEKIEKLNFKSSRCSTPKGSREIALSSNALLEREIALSSNALLERAARQWSRYQRGLALRSCESEASRVQDVQEPRERSGNLSTCQLVNLLTRQLVNDLTTCPDLAQTMVATCCGMGVPFRFSGLQSLRIKETDRLLALQQELAKLGYEVKVQDEELVYTPLSPGAPFGKEMDSSHSEGQGSGSVSIDTYDDHRMAMCMAPLAMLREGLVIRDAQVVSKSYPTFWSDMESVGCTVEKL